MLLRLLVLVATLLALTSAPSGAQGDVYGCGRDEVSTSTSVLELGQEWPSPRVVAPLKPLGGARIGLGDVFPAEGDDGESDGGPSRADNGADRLAVDHAPVGGSTGSGGRAFHGHPRPSVRLDAPRGPPSAR